MSIFETRSFPCPECNESVNFDVVASVNADRRPDLRDAILDESFQRGTCENCEHSFRVEPQMTYFDLARQQWILVEAAENYVRWPEMEQIAQETFDLAYGPNASGAAQEIGRGLNVRVTFGWPAIREKLLCGEHGLDDVALESLKVTLLLGLDECPLSDQVELRLINVEDDQLELHWIETATGRSIESMIVPRSLYDSTASADGYDDLRSQLTAGAFVDISRILVDSPA